MAKKFPFWATQTIVDIGNGDPNIIEPDQIKKDRGWIAEKPLLQHMNWIQSLFSWFVIGFARIVGTSTNNYQTEVGQRINVDNTTIAKTVLLPTDPEDGQWVEIGAKDLVSERPVTVTCQSPKSIMIANDRSFVYDIDGATFMFFYNASEQRWYARLTGANGVIE